MWTVARRNGCAQLRKVGASSTRPHIAVVAQHLHSTTVNQQSSLSKPKPKPKSKLVETTNALLHQNVAWSKDQFESAEVMLHGWSKHPHKTAETLEKCFQMLERMVVEAERQPKFQLKTKHLNLALDRWRIASRYNMADRHQWSAARVLERVNTYSQRVPSLQPDTKTYSLLMAVETKLRPRDAPKLCTELLQRMKRSDTCKPNAVVFTHVMDAYVKSRSSDAPAATQAIWDYLVESSDLEPTEKSLTRVLQAWITSGTDQASSHMDRAVNYMLASAIKDSRVLPNSVFLNLVLSSCLEQNRERVSAPLADALMSRVYDEARQFPQLAPTGEAYNHIINIWVKSRLPQAPDRVEYWLERMTEASLVDPKHVPPPQGSLFTAGMAACESSGRPESADKGEALWDRMIQDSNTTITASGYYLLLSLLSKSDAPDAPHKAERLLRDMINQSKRNPKLLPSAYAFVYVICSWRKSGLLEAPIKAQATLELLLQEHDRRPDRLKLNDTAFNATIHTWAMSGLPEASTRAHELVKKMQKLSQRNPKVAPSIVTAWSVLQTLDKNSPEAATEATRLLDFIDNESGNSNKSLRSQIFEHVLRFLSSSERVDAPEKAQAILDRIFQEPPKQLRLDYVMTCYRHVLNCWKHCHRIDASEKMESLLEDMAQATDRFSKHASDPHSYLQVAEAWAASGLPQAPAKVEQVLKHMTATTEVYGSIIESWARSGSPESADRARALLDEMVELYQGGNALVKPTARCFAPVMSAYANQHDDGMVEELWNRLQGLNSSNGDPDFLPDKDVLRALSRSDGSQAIREAAILHMVLERAQVSKQNIPDDATFDSVLDSLVKSCDPTAGQRAETILLQMQELHEEGYLEKPAFRTFQKVLDCWATSSIESATQRTEEILKLAEGLYEAGDDDLKPTFEGYMSVVTALSRSHARDAPERIQLNLRKMQQRFDAGADDFNLDERAYCALITAYAQSGRDDAPHMAQAVYDQTPDRFKSTSMCNALILAQGGDSNRAEVLLQEMHEEYLQGNEQIKPDTSTFNNVILAWSKSGSPMAAWRVDGIFNRMTELTQSGKLSVQPNSKTFDLVIATIANDWGADAATKVDRYLELLKDLYYQSRADDCKPSVISYTEAIRVWGSNVDDPRAVLRAKALLDEMHELAQEGIESVKPDRSTYMVYLKALALSSLSEKAGIAKDVLATMKENKVEPDDAVIAQIQRCYLPAGVPSTAWTVLCEDGDEFPSFMSPSNNVGGSSLVFEDTAH